MSSSNLSRESVIESKEKQESQSDAPISEEDGSPFEPTGRRVPRYFVKTLNAYPRLAREVERASGETVGDTCAFEGADLCRESASRCATGGTSWVPA